MAENVARQYSVAQPLQQPQSKPVVHNEPKTKSVPLTFVEKSLITIFSLLVVGLMLTVITLRINLVTQQRQLQTQGETIEKVASTNAEYKQEIGELTRYDRLSAFAQAHGLKLNESNIRNVIK